MICNIFYILLDSFSVFLKNFASIFVRDISVLSSFLVISFLTLLVRYY